MRVFADTSALYALLVRNDYMHVRAKLNFAHFREHQARLVTTSFVIVETVALLQRRVGMEAVYGFQSRIIPLLDIIWVDKELYNKAIQRLLALNKRGVSLVDCLSFEVMEARGIALAFTFDRHFAEFGFSMADSTLAGRP